LVMLQPGNVSVFSFLFLGSDPRGIF
jgi:hypothetical protein